MLLLAIFPLTLPVAILHITLLAIGAGFGALSFFQLWSAELFPTIVRATAQGVALAIVRIGLGIWSYFVPVLTSGLPHTRVDPHRLPRVEHRSWAVVGAAQ